ncbi:MAG: phenylacetate--CoA ligase family protein [Blastocatellia bacterium]|nr:phenylacetate--CoA ligase family protein [Blastocatellia bacterium]
MLNPDSPRPDPPLRRLVRHAYANVKHYRRIFDECGLKPEDVQSVADLAPLAITTKADLQREPDEFIARGVDRSRLLERITSGSTGQPASIRNSPFDEFRRQLARWRVDIGYGVRPGDRRVRFRTPRPLLAGDRMLLAVLESTHLYMQRKVDSRLPGDEALAILRAFRPTIIDGMSNSIDRAAQMALDAGDTAIRPRYVTTGGETLTPGMRQRIGEAFGAPIRDIFGACEFGVMASECPVSGLYHVASGVALEIIGSDGLPARDGAEGQVVATSLLSRAVPVIRYGTGDIAVRGPDACPCGYRGGTLREVRGRIVDVFRLPDGRTLHPWQFPIRSALWIRSFHLVQEREDRFVLCLVPTPGASPNDIVDGRQAMVDMLGPSVEFSIETVERLDAGPGGKLRPFQPLGLGTGARIDSAPRSPLRSDDDESNDEDLSKRTSRCVDR